MSAAIGASAAGAPGADRHIILRTCIYVGGALHCRFQPAAPALALVNRALSGPININCDHSDSMGARDSGWIQIYAENNQEAYDNMVQAFRISEHKDVKLPIMICQDGFITSHAVENIELLEDEEVRSFVGEYEPENYLLNPDCPMAVGPYSVTDYYMEAKRNQAEGMRHVEQVVLDTAKEFAELSGREYGLFEAYRLEDAERAVVMIGSAAGTTKDAIDRLREKGEKVGLLKIRLYRPFPADAIAEALKNVKAVAVMDRAEGYSNHGGPLGADVMAALFRARSTALATNIIYGLGGRDVRVEDMEQVFEDLQTMIDQNDAGETYRYMGLRE